MKSGENIPKNGPGDSFLAGIIEGFYGQPWTPAERFELFERMTSWGLNTYVYAPKDDLKHRAIWRQTYSAPEEAGLRTLIQACNQRHISFVYALSPGLDIHYGNETDLDHLHARFGQMQALGCRNFALLFDDIPDCLNHEDLRRWGSLASAQCHIANTLFRWAREQWDQALFFFCPTPYCGRMVKRNTGGEGYLQTLGRELIPEIDVFWTGPEIISQAISVEHVREVRSILGRKPLIWDNLHANDYDGRRFYCGPYSGRPLELRGEVKGLLSNPNTEFLLNFVPLCTLAQFVHCQGFWDARQAYLSGMREWLACFATVGAQITFEDLVLLGDCYYLPHEEGPEAEAFYRCVRSLLTKHRSEWKDQETTFLNLATRLREVCIRMTELCHRRLFHALSRRVWELREELDLLLGYVNSKSGNGDAAVACHSDFHLPGVYRGGLVSRLQRLLVQRSDGAFEPAQPSTTDSL